MDPLLVLGLKPGDTLPQARKRFKDLARIYHPDKNGDAEKFSQVKEALDELEADPCLLLPLPAKLDNNRKGTPLAVPLTVPVDAAYWESPIPVSVTRLDRCERCEGTGSLDKTLHTCTTCDGSGKIQGGFYRNISDGDDRCPCCSATGIDWESVTKCEACSGSGLQKSQHTFNLRVTLQDLMTGAKEVRGAGNFGKNMGPNGGLFLKLSRRGVFSVRNGVLHVPVNVSPARFVLGGEISASLLGERVKVPFRGGEETVEFTHLGKPVTLLVMVRWPSSLTEGQRGLYTQLLESEGT